MALPRVPRWIRFGVSLGMMGTLLFLIPVRQVVAALALVSPLVLALALMVLVGGHVAAALKWRMLQGGNTGISIKTALRAHFCGVLANLWLPGVVGGDVVRAGAILHETSRSTLVVLASFVDRIVDFAALLALTAAGLLLVGSPSPRAWPLWIAGSCVIVACGAGVVGIYRHAKSRRSSSKLRALIEAVDMMTRRPGRVAAAFAISVCIQTSFILVNAMLGRAVGMTAPISAWFVAWPLAKLAALVPISAAGIGVREAALIALMRPFGEPARTVMAAGLLWQATFIAVATLGAGFFLLLPVVTRSRDDRLSPSVVRGS